MRCAQQATARAAATSRPVLAASLCVHTPGLAAAPIPPECVCLALAATAAARPGIAGGQSLISVARAGAEARKVAAARVAGLAAEIVAAKISLSGETPARAGKAHFQPGHILLQAGGRQWGWADLRESPREAGEVPCGRGSG